MCNSIAIRTNIRKQIIFASFLAIVPTLILVSQSVISTPTFSPHSQMLCGATTWYDPATHTCDQFNKTIQCIATCENHCFNPTTHYCSNGTVCSLGQQLCLVKYNSSHEWKYSSPKYHCYHPTSKACFRNRLCDHPSRSCNQQCLKNNEVCVNNATICQVKTFYQNYNPGQIQLCNGVCYNSAIQQCIDDTVECIQNCSHVCYNPWSHICLNGTVCNLHQQLCLVKYNNSDGSKYSSPRYQCYDPTSDACFNNNLCDHPNRSCNGQCLKTYEVCVNDTTICKLAKEYNHYKVGQIQLCNGTCYDSTIQQCVNDRPKCIKSCSHVCYALSSHICLLRTLCSLGEQICYVKSNPFHVSQYTPSPYNCYDPTKKACYHNTLCDHPSRSCNQRCLEWNEMCLNHTTICKGQRPYYDYKDDQIQSCNGVCYESAIEQCVNNSVQCINKCSYTCYNPSAESCFSGTLCKLGQQLCHVKYNNSNGSKYNPPKYECYDPTSKVCFNNTLCDHPSRSCNQQCLESNEVCVDDVTICKVNGFHRNYEDDQIQLCNGVCYDSAIQQCINDIVQCIKNCSHICYNPSSHFCSNETVCKFGEQLCHVKYTNSFSELHTPSRYVCYNPTFEACFNNTLCNHPSRSCNQQCLESNEVCVNHTTICKRQTYYYDDENNQIESCNGVCYDSAIEQCVNNSVQCINKCSYTCYNPSAESCFNGTLCKLGQQLCHIKYFSSDEWLYTAPKYECYDPTTKVCFKNTLCDRPSRSCNQQCLESNEVCVNDVTICKVDGFHRNYEDDRIQLCNGVCYDSEIQQCINDIVHCIKNCSHICYNPSSHFCLNGTVCKLGQQLCHVKYTNSYWDLHTPSRYVCYNPSFEACFNNTLCYHPSRSCNQQCLESNEVCVNDSTICKVERFYYSYKDHQIQTCNGVCYDSAIRQCVNDIVQCIKNCSHTCYNPLEESCFNGTLCKLGEQLCYVKYSSAGRLPYNPPKYECYAPTVKVCFNNILCDRWSRSCNQQCLQWREVCVNDSTICKVERFYYDYEDHPMQTCNGVCYDSTIRKCVNESVECIKNCSKICYNPSSQSCFNGTLCSFGQRLCHVKYTSSDGWKYGSPKHECYDPTWKACFNNTLCDHPSRSCNAQCLKDKELCVSGRTICKVERSYYDYKVGQIQLCNGACYDSTIQQCFNESVECIKNCSNVCYNSSSQSCFNGTLCSLNQQLCHVKYASNSREYSSERYVCYDPTRQIQSCNGVCYDSRIEQCVNDSVECIKNCSDVCYNPSSQSCFNGTLCSLGQQLCYVKDGHFTSWKYTPLKHECYNPTSKVCSNNTLCDHPSRSCNQQCLQSDEVCLNHTTICKLMTFYLYYMVGQIQLCNGVCYDSLLQQCVNDRVECIKNCSDVCYYPSSQSCVNGTVCGVGEQLCHVKYSSSDGHKHSSPWYVCYYPTVKACFNNTLCDYPSGSCNQQCLKHDEVCVNDTTVCKVPNARSHYKAGQIQICNGVCYNSTIKRCVNDRVECIKNCSDVCYNPSSQSCFNGTLCSLGQQLCYVNSPFPWSVYMPPKFECYDPTSKACFNNTLCDHPSRSCNQQCLEWDEVCVNDVTICKVNGFHRDYQDDRIQLCNAVCYDSAIQQCVNESVQCIKSCSDVCYNPSSQSCFNGTLCRLHEQLCYVKYDSSDGRKYSSPRSECYHPSLNACFNNTLCDYPSRTCNQQCLKRDEVCVNDTTICKVKRSYYNYKGGQIQLCNGFCYDSEIQQCVNDSVKCIDNGSNVC